MLASKVLSLVRESDSKYLIKSEITLLIFPHVVYILGPSEKAAVVKDIVGKSSLLTSKRHQLVGVEVFY